MSVYTVTGPIAASDVSWASMHEHVYCDGRVWYEPPDTPPPAGQRVCPSNLGWLRWNIHGLEDNLVLDDDQAAEIDLIAFAAAGGSTIVELSTLGLGRDLEGLRRASLASGVQIVAGTGLYVADSQPGWACEERVDSLASWMASELTDGVGESRIRPGLIGEIGTSAPVHDQERRVLAAAAQAAAATKAAINVHLDPRGAHALEILEVLIAEGASAERVIFSHLDERLDLGYHEEVLAAGAIAAYDTFGSEFYWGDLHRDPTDSERLEALAELVARGYSGQCVIGCDVWMKCLLTRYGGPGYVHLPARILPALESRFGLTPAVLADLVCHNPRRLLNRP